MTEASDTITTLTQERDAMRVVLTSEIDARIKAESRALTADGLRVQLAEAQDRLTFVTAEAQRVRARAEEAEADRDAAKTRIAAALRCMEGKHYPAAIQALTIGTAQGCALPPDLAMLKRLEEVTAERDHLRKEWDAHEAQIRKQERGYVETVASLTAERDAAREQHKALTAALGLAERARDGWRGRALTAEVNVIGVRIGTYGRPCPGCAECREPTRCGAHRADEDAPCANLTPCEKHPNPGHPAWERRCGGSEWVATASPEPARNAPQPDPEILRRDVERLTRQRDEAKQAAQVALGSSDRAAQALRAAQELAEVLRRQRDEAQALVQKVRDFADDEQKRAEFFQVEESKALDRVLTAEKERDEWKARAKEAEDRASYFARGRNKASADADKAQRERDEARAEVAILRAGDERPADLIIKTRQSLDAALAEWRDKAIKAAPHVALVRDMAALDPIFDDDYLAKSKTLVSRACVLIEPAGDAPAPIGIVAESAPRSPDPEPLAPLLALARDLADLHPPVAYNPWTTTVRRLIAQARTLTGWRDATAEGSSVAVSTAPDRSDLQRAILLLASRPAPTHEAIQRLCKWIGGIPLGETHRVLMELCESGRIVNRGLPDGYRLADEAAVHVALLGTTPGGYDAPAPVAPEQVERIETAPSWARAWDACQGMWAAYRTPAIAFNDPLYAAAKAADELICKGTSLTRSEKDAHAAIDALEKAARDASLWWRSIGVLTDFARSILALREATPRPEPIPADVPTGQEDQHDADMRATEPTLKETP